MATLKKNHFGIEVTKLMKWDQWEPGGEYTQLMTLKNVNSKTKKLKFKYVLLIVLMTTLLFLYWLITIFDKMKSVKVNKIEHKFNLVKIDLMVKFFEHIYDYTFSAPSHLMIISSFFYCLQDIKHKFLHYKISTTNYFKLWYEHWSPNNL